MVMFMEIKINKEIRSYTENIYFGLSLRQFFFSVLACVLAIIIYFTFHGILPNEIVSWLCILVAILPITIGFVTYNGMPAEVFLKEIFKFYFLIPRCLLFNSVNYYNEILKRKENYDV